MKRKSSAIPPNLSCENSTTDKRCKLFQTTFAFYKIYLFLFIKHSLIEWYLQPFFLNICYVVKDLYLVKNSFFYHIGVPAFVLQLFSNSLSKSLFKLFSISLGTSSSPSIWKESYIIPLLKKGSMFDASKYRGIS